jgi:hypothetical protein
LDIYCALHIQKASLFVYSRNLRIFNPLSSSFICCSIRSAKIRQIPAFAGRQVRHPRSMFHFAGDEETFSAGSGTVVGA